MPVSVSESTYKNGRRLPSDTRPPNLVTREGDVLETVGLGLCPRPLRESVTGRVR